MPTKINRGKIKHKRHNIKEEDEEEFENELFFVPYNYIYQEFYVDQTGQLLNCNAISWMFSIELHTELCFTCS